MIDSKGKFLETKDYVKLIQSKSPRIYQTSIFDENDKLLLMLESHFDYSSSYRYIQRRYYRKHSGNARHLFTSILYKAKNIDVSNAKFGIAE